MGKEKSLSINRRSEMHSDINNTMIIVRKPQAAKKLKISSRSKSAREKDPELQGTTWINDDCITSNL